MNKFVTEYTILESNTSYELRNLVNKQLQFGWQPVGEARCIAAVKPAIHEGPYVWFQTMVKFGD